MMHDAHFMIFNIIITMYITKNLHKEGKPVFFLFIHCILKTCLFQTYFPP